MNSRQTTFDALIIGAGVIGLSTAYELARESGNCCVIGAERAGETSGAAAGLLAPSIGRDLPPAVHAFFTASLRLYPKYIASLRSKDPDLRLVEGLIEIPGVSPSDRDAPAGVALSSSELAELEPGVVSDRGGVLHPADGAVDNVRLLTALREAVRRHPNITVVSGDPVVAIDAPGGSVRLDSGVSLRGAVIIVAAGAWTAQVDGLPRTIPVTPLKGQMLAVDSTVLRHAVMGPDIYLVPRADETVIGATVERDGFDVTTTDDAIAGLRRAAAAIAPSLATAKETRRWAGVRPATPDMLPIIGRDPDMPNLIYACGHSKNGILLAPATARVVVDLVRQRPSPFDLSFFGVDRFRDT